MPRCGPRWGQGLPLVRCASASPGFNLHGVITGGESWSAWLSTVFKTQERICFISSTQLREPDHRQVARLFFTDRPWLGATQSLEPQQSVLKLAIAQLIAVPLREALCNNHIWYSSLQIHISSGEWSHKESAQNRTLPLPTKLSSLSSRAAHIYHLFMELSLSPWAIFSRLSGSVPRHQSQIDLHPC